MSVDVDVRPVAADERLVLRHLFELYAYDFSELVGLDVGADGRFDVPDLSVYGTEDGRHAFLARVDGQLAGFALVSDRSRLSGTRGIHDMAEFFVLRRYRRRGVGERFARELFARFRGPWEIRERPENAAASAFWRSVVGRHTDGRFRDVTWNDATWTGPVQLFDSRGAT